MRGANLFLAGSGDAVVGSEEHFTPRMDLRRDSRGDDPLVASPTLRAYHLLLWDKPLPTGGHFSLRDESECGDYLVHESVLDRFSLASDTCVPRWTTWSSSGLDGLAETIPPRYDRVAHQMGAMLLLPRNSPGEFRGSSVSHDRMTSGYIADRIDLTLECIRLHYLQRSQPSAVGDNPLSSTLARWADFFELFGDFTGFVDFFLLNDLLASDGESIDFLLPFDGFTWWPLPRDAQEYAAYMDRIVSFVDARHCRMEEWVKRSPRPVGTLTR